MDLDTSTKNSLALKQSHELDASEGYDRGMSMWRTPKRIAMIFHESNIQSERQLSAEMRDMSSINLFHDTHHEARHYNCFDCGACDSVGPGSVVVDRCNHIETAWKSKVHTIRDWDSDKKVEMYEHLMPLCNDCMMTHFG